MDWTDLVVTATKEQIEAAEAAVTAFAGAGYYLEDYSDLEEQVQNITRSQIIDQELLDKPRDIIKLHVYISPDENPAAAAEGLHGVLLAAGVSYTMSTAAIKQEDWETSWKQYYHPIEVGSRLAVAPSWEEYSSQRVVLRMDPGMAFGTGTHETTFMCLEWLDEKIKGGEKALDIGTGSGVLAVAALLLGAESAIGVDIDPLSVRIAKENAQRNHVEDRFEVRVGDLATQVNGKYNCITANIVANAIIELAPAIPPLLADDGYFIASGIIAPREEEVKAALEKAGLKLLETRRKKEWVAMLAVKAG